MKDKISEAKVIISNGFLNIMMESYLEKKIIELAAATYGERLANQQMLSKVYTVEELAGPTGRLKLSKQTIRAAINDGRLRTTKAGLSKGYIISELACREFMGDVKRVD